MRKLIKTIRRKAMTYFLNGITPINQFTKTTKEKYFIDKNPYSQNEIKEIK